MGVFDPETQASHNAPSISADDFFFCRRLTRASHSGRSGTCRSPWRHPDILLGAFESHICDQLLINSPAWRRESWIRSPSRHLSRVRRLVAVSAATPWKKWRNTGTDFFKDNIKPPINMFSSHWQGCTSSKQGLYSYPPSRVRPSLAASLLHARSSTKIAWRHGTANKLFME